MLACAGGFVVLVGALAFLALRVLGESRTDGLGRARSRLHRRLADGEIDIEEYYERESALRQAEPPRRRGVRR
jgi:uncharacterized membrane protein